MLPFVSSTLQCVDGSTIRTTNADESSHKHRETGNESRRDGRRGKSQR